MNRRNFIAGASGMVLAAGIGYGGWRSSLGSMADYERYAAGLRTELVPPEVHYVIRYATLAANSDNTQPWRFRVGDHAIDILPDFARRTPVVDPDDHHLFVSLGCAAANLALAASGRPGDISIAEDGNGLHYEFNSGSPRLDHLSAAINKRQSTRAEYDGRPVAIADLELLKQAAAIPGTGLVLIVDPRQIGRIRDLVVAGNDEQIADPEFMRELKHWIRFNAKSAIASGDGLFSAASGNPSLPIPLGRIAIDLLLSARSEGAKYARQIDSSAGDFSRLARAEVALRMISKRHLFKGTFGSEMHLML